MGTGCSSLDSQDPAQSDIKYLVQNTNFTESTITAFLAAFRQDSEDGHISRTRFITMFTETFFPQGCPEQFGQQVFQALDTDGNDKLSFREFVLGMNITSTGTQEDKLRWAFRLYDASGDGVLQEEEFSDLLSLNNLSPKPGSDNPPVDPQCVLARGRAGRDRSHHQGGGQGDV